MVTLLFAALAAFHPLHTTMTELTVDQTSHTVRAVTRVFADDFGRAAKQSAPELYVAQRLSIVEGPRRVELKSCGVRRTGDVMLVCVEGRFAGSVGELRVSNALLCELFDDQVNIIQVVDGAKRKSVLFVKGDVAKTILLSF